MPKVSCLILLFGLAPSIAGLAPGALAAGKIVDMGPIDAPTILRACQQARATPVAGGDQYGCSTRNVSIQCNAATCNAIASDLTPLSGASLQSVIQAMQQRAGRQILPLDARVKANQRPVQ
jgi:hypothetical protein